MQVGDLVMYRTNAGMSSPAVGIVIKNAEKGKWKTAWWSILWSNGKTEIVSDRTLKVINENR